MICALPPCAPPASDLSGQADPHPGALCAGRHRRHRLAHHRRQADGSLGPAGGGGEQARRQRLHRHDGGRQGRARRLHAGHGHGRRRRDQPGDVQGHALRRGTRPRADRAVSDAPMVLAANGARPTRPWPTSSPPPRRSRGGISVATPGNGSINQIVLEWMALNTGTKFQHIPYKGGAPAAAALAGGDVPLGVLASSSVAPHVKAGRVRVLAVTRRQALEVQSGMADPAEAGRQGGRRLELDRAVRTQGHAAADHRQAQRRGGEDSRHARRQGALRRRRRRHHPVDPGRARRAREARPRALPRDRAEGEHPAGLIRLFRSHRPRRRARTLRAPA